MRKQMAITLILILVLFVVNQAQESKGRYIFKRLSYLTYGTGRDQIGLLNVPGIPQIGPESFWVDNHGEIYICDTVNKQIKHFSKNGKIIRNLPLNFSCSDLAVDKKGNLFLLDRSTGLLHRFAKNGRESAVIRLRRDLIKAMDTLRFSGSDLVTTTIEQEEYVIGEFKAGNLSLLSNISFMGKEGIRGREKMRFLTKIDSFGQGEITILTKEGKIQKTITLPSEEIASIVFLGQDEEGNFYIQVERRNKEGIGIILSVYCFDSEGNLDSVIENIPNNYWVWTTKLLQVNANGDIYQVLPTKNGVEINLWKRREY